MPAVNNIPQSKPWYKKSSTWAWIVTGASILALIIIMAVDEAAERKEIGSCHTLVQFWCIFLDPKNKKNPL